MKDNPAHYDARVLYTASAFCARQLLAGIKITSNERMHSPGEKILSAVRGCLKPANVEKLTLGYFFVRK
jgi:hypothetical protein